MNSPVIVFEELGYAWRAQGPWVLRGYRGAVAKGGVFAILGPNGRGKTTLLKLLLGALKPQEGRVSVQGRLAFVPQLFQVSFPYRVLDMVLMGRARQVGMFSLPSREDESAALAALERLGLADIAEKPFDELSGGQRQLVIFARALASGADILVLDEPTSALDLKNQHRVLRWIAALAREEGMTVVMTTHHPQHAWAVADNVLLMLGTQEYLCGSPQRMLNDANLLRLYGVPLKQVSVEYEGRIQTTLVPIYL